MVPCYLALLVGSAFLFDLGGMVTMKGTIKTIINIKKFIYRYFGIILDQDTKYSHNSLNKILDDYIPEDNDKRDLLYVMDDYGYIRSYTRPTIEYNIESSSITNNDVDKYENAVLATLEITPTYALYELLSIYKHNHRVNKAIKNELTSRGLYTDESDKLNFDNILEVLNDIPTYALHELLSTYKRHYSIYRRIKNELINRGEYDNKLYKLREIVDRVEEETHYDEEADYDLSQCNDDLEKFNRRLRIRSRKRVNKKGRWY